MKAAPWLVAAILWPGASLAAEFRTALYHCERDVRVQVTYINTDEGNFAVLFVEGNLVPMRQFPSASGTRYIAIDEQNSYRWYSHRGEATLGWLAADHTASEDMLLTACKAQ